MVMPRLSYSLKDKQQDILVFDLETIQKIIIQLTLGLHEIHQKGYVHCDLKPQNIMILEVDGLIEVKIIDFGLCDRIIKDGQHVEAKGDDGVKGTYVYMSRAAHEGARLSRRDDWESLCYVIFALVNGELPWHWETDKDKMRRMKEEFVQKQQWVGMPEIFKKYTDMIFKLGFKDQPKHMELISILLRMNSSYYEFKWNDFIEEL